jgi:hypothetical protein
MDLRAIEKREEREREGVWIPLHSGVSDDKAEVLVIGLDSPKYTQTLYTRMMPLRAKYGKDELPESEMNTLISDVTVDIVLLNWRGIELDGKPLEFSKEIAREWMRKSDHFRDMVSSAAIRASRMLKEEFEKDVAALKKVSAPVSTQPSIPAK